MTERARSFSAIVDLIRRANAKGRATEEEDEPTASDDEDDPQPKKTKKKAKPEIEDQSDEGDEPKDEGEDSEDRLPQGKGLTPARIAALAEQIVNAGRQRRGEIPIENPPPVASEASRFAGREQYTTPVENPGRMAAQIVEAGRKRRGEA